LPGLGGGPGLAERLEVGQELVADFLAELEGGDRLLTQGGRQLGGPQGLQVAGHQVGKPGRGEPEAAGLGDQILVSAGQVEAEELGLLLFQAGLLLDGADLVVRELLQAGGALFLGKPQVLGDVADLAGDAAEDFLAATQGLAEDADAH
jgi:hypothetical protein